MNKLLKSFGLFVGIGLLNTIIFALYLSISGLPGGEVGMAPYLILLESAKAIIISTIVYLIFRNKFEVTTIRIILLYQVVYFLILIIAGVNPFDDNHAELALWMYIISFLVTGGLIMTIKLNSGPSKNKN